MAVILERCFSLDVGTFRPQLAMPGTWSGSVRWSSGDEETASISYRIFTSSARPLLILLYSIDGQNVTQTVELEAVPSNLHRGQYWLFICPVSGRRCKKLHLIHGLFQHRTALPGVFYRQQARAKWLFGRYLDAYEGISEILEAAEQPYFREYYAGKPTRRTLRMLRKVEKLKPRMSKSIANHLLSGGGE